MCLREATQVGEEGSTGDTTRDARFESGLGLVPLDNKRMIYHHTC